MVDYEQQASDILTAAKTNDVDGMKRILANKISAINGDDAFVAALECGNLEIVKTMILDPQVCMTKRGYDAVKMYATQELKTMIQSMLSECSAPKSNSWCVMIDGAFFVRETLIECNKRLQ